MINETDISLAKASNAIVIGFNIKPNKEAKKLSEVQKVRIEFFNIIYKALLNLLKNHLSGLLEPERKEKIEGTAEILKFLNFQNLEKLLDQKLLMEK